MSKVIIVDGYAGAFTNFRAQLIDDMVALGHHVTALAPESADDMGPILAARGARYRQIPLQRTGANPLMDMAVLWALYRLFRQERPEVLMLYSVKAVIYGAIAGRLAGINTVSCFITGLGYGFTATTVIGRTLGFLQRWLYFIALRCANQIYFQNPDDEAAFRDLGILAKDSFVKQIGGSGVDLQSFEVSTCPDGAIFLMISRFLHAKGFSDYCEAAAKVRSRFPAARFQFAGWIDKDNPDAISELQARQMLNEGGVEFLGRLSDVRPALANCTVYVLPSYREGTPRSTLEAMAVGRAVITTDVPGCRETVVRGVNGFLVPVRDADALSAAMEKFLVDPGLAKQFGVKSREMCERRFDVRRVNETILKGVGLLT